MSLVESIVSLLPCRAEGHEQDGLVVLLLCTHGLFNLVLITFHVRHDIVVIVVVTCGETACNHHCHHGNEQEFNLLHSLLFDLN